MRVLLIDVYNYNKGGAETVCFNTGKLLEQMGHEVIYFTLKWDKNLPSPFEKYFPESKETRKGLFKHFHNLINYFYYQDAARKIEQLIIDYKPDIAHIHLMWGQISPSIFPVLKKHNIPIVFTIHDYRIICPAYAFRNGKGEVCETCQGKYFYKCFTNKCTKGSYFLSSIMASEQYFRNVFFNPSKYIDGLIYVSNFARTLHDKYMPALNNKPNIVLHNFTKQYEKSELKKELKDKYYLFFGRLSPEKGLKTLIEAFKIRNDLRLKIVGTGPMERELKASTQSHNIQLLGYKSGDELKKIIQDAHFSVVPSEWYEKNPMSIMESYSLGVPIIASDIGGIPEIIEDFKTGFVFKTGNVDDLLDKLKRAEALSESSYTQMINNVLEYSNKKFNPNIYVDQLIDFYNDVFLSYNKKS